MSSITAKIETAISNDSLVKIDFRYRSSIIGKFVSLKDHDDLLKKKMVRFVSKSKISDDNTFLTVDVKIFNYTDFTDIKKI